MVHGESRRAHSSPELLRSLNPQKVHIMSDAQSQARAQYDSLAEMMSALDVDFDRLADLRDSANPDEAKELEELKSKAGEYESTEDVERAIDEKPLSIEIRSDWCSPGAEMTPGEYRIVLCTGGPHVEIVGELAHDGSPHNARILFSDWGESGEFFDFDRDIVIAFASRFFGG